MPKSLVRKISLSFIPIIFAKGHIMNSPFVAIVPLYALVVAAYDIWSWYWFADFTRLKSVLSYICRCICCHTLRHGPRGGHCYPSFAIAAGFWPFPLLYCNQHQIGRPVYIMHWYREVCAQLNGAVQMQQMQWVPYAWRELWYLCVCVSGITFTFG